MSLLNRFRSIQAGPRLVELDFTLNGEFSVLPLGEFSHVGNDRVALSWSGDDLAFDLPSDAPVYLVQPGNTLGFQSAQKHFIAIPDAERFIASVSIAGTAPVAALYLFVCDDSGTPLVRKAMKLGETTEINFARPAGATQAFVAIRLVGKGKLRRVGLRLSSTTLPVELRPGIDPSFTAAVRLLADGQHDELLDAYVERIAAEHSTTRRTRYIGAAANEAARAKRYAVETRCLERLNAMSPSPSLQQKIARSLYRDANYPALVELVARWPHILDTQPTTPFHDGAQELAAANALARHIAVPHAERYRDLTDAPRVAYCLHNSLPYASGGYATRSHGLMCGLLASGGAGSVLARPGFPSDTKADTDAPRGPSSQVVDGVEYRFENSFGRPGQLFRYMRRAGDYFAATARQDVTVIQSASNFYTGLAGSYAAASRRLPFVYEIRGFWELTRASRDEAFSSSPIYHRNRRLEQAAAHLADHVLTLTPSMKREIESWGIPPERVTLAPNAVDPQLFAPIARDAALAARLGLSPDDIVIGYVGSFIDYEGLDMLVDATIRLMQRDPRVRLLMVGDDSPGGKASTPVSVELRAQANASGVGDRMIFTGRIPHDEVPAHYSLVDICPFPRRPVAVCEMVSPMKPLEAMAMGKCLVVSSVGGMEGMVHDDRTGIVFQKGSEDSLLAALTKAVDDPDLRRRLGAEARSWAKRERSWNNVARSVVDLHGALTSGEAGFRNRPEDHRLALAAFAAAFPTFPESPAEVIGAAA